MDGYPGAFLNRMQNLLRDEYAAFEACLKLDAERALRLNPLKKIEDSGDVVPWEPDGRYVRADFRIDGDPMHFAGAYYMQDASAMAPARVLAVQPGEMVLDLCAAPGGKAGQLAAALMEGGVLIANEPEHSRAKALSGNLERLGVRNAAVVSALPETLANKWPEAFDAILVDAPCSGEGMFRRDEDARREWREGAPAGCAIRQAGILRQAAKLLRPGGRLCYATCTFSELENERMIETFLSEHPDFATAPFALPGVGEAENGMLRLWPHKLRGEGHFVALLNKAGKKMADVPTLARIDLRAKAVFEQLKQTLPGTWVEMLTDFSLELHNETLWALPPDMPNLAGLRVLRAGLCLCHLQRKVIKPDHALAMTLLPVEVEHSVEVTRVQADQFLRGHELSVDEGASGWKLVCYQGLPLGFGKASSGALKNHIPKGIRLN